MGLRVRLHKKVNGFALDIEWQIGNELAVLFGFSGAGKSMTLQLIAGLLKPDNGQLSLDDSVYFDSSTGTNLPPQERPFGYVFQDLALFPHMTVLQNILYGAAILPKAVAISDKIIVYEQGKIAQIDSPERIKNSPANIYVSNLIAYDERNIY